MTAIVMRDLASSPRFWLAALAASLAALLVLGVPSGIVPNPIFIRTVETRVADMIVWLISALLIGLTLATYVARPHRSGHGDPGPFGLALVASWPSSPLPAPCATRSSCFSSA